VVEITIVPNPLEPERVELHTAPGLIPWLVERYGHWPAAARLCHVWGALEVDVTPTTEVDAEALSDLPGPFIVREHPEGVAAIVVVGIVVLVAAVAAILLIPEVPNVRAPAQRAALGGSPNNQLGKRSNKARVGERIPDIYGNVRSYPDLLMQPYSIYGADHREREIAYYCVGRGSHSMTAVRDGNQLGGSIEGWSAEIYGPGTAPLGGIPAHTPSATIGDPVLDDVHTVFRVEAVNGQQLRAWSDGTFYGSAILQAPVGVGGTGGLLSTARFTHLGGANGKIELPFSASSTEITSRLDIGDELFVYWPTAYLPAGTGTAPDLSTPATQLIPLEVTGLIVTAIVPIAGKVEVSVTIPAAQQAQWALLAPYFGVPGPLFEFAEVTNVSRRYVGPFFSDFQHDPGSIRFELICNFVAPNGLYQDDGTTLLPLDKIIQIIVTPTDAGGTPSGPPEVFARKITGATTGGQRAISAHCRPTGFGTNTRCLVQACLLTNSPRKQRLSNNVEFKVYGARYDRDPPKIAYYSGRVVDEVRWVDCYSISTPPNISFGNVTTIHTSTLVTEGATRIKDRALNVIAARNINTWNGVTFGGPLIPSDKAENVLFAVMKDTLIGNLPDASIDFAGIAAAFELVRTKVFDTSPLATAFAYTFDETDISLEETIQVICQACFAQAYRRGPVISVRPEVAHDDSVILLNHRNVSPGSMKITHNFGTPTENDSVECVYTDAFAGTSSKVRVPVFGANLRPRQLNVAGISSERQAYWHAYRAYHKMLYQRQSVSLEAAQEGAVAGVRQRVLIADLTRPGGVQDGEVVAISGATVRTSQPVLLNPARTYTLFLQDPAGVVQERAVVSSPNTQQLVLASAPSPAPIIDSALGVRTLYQLVADDQPTPGAYLVSSTRPSAELTVEMTAVNYSHLYYLADGLQTWVTFSNGLKDLSPIRRSYSVGGSPIISGGLWTGVAASYFQDSRGGSFEPTTPSYTKEAWITATAPTASHINSTSNDTSQQFILELDQHLYGGHGGSYQVGFDYSALLGTLHQVALSYDAVTQRMVLLVDGALVDEATVAPSGTSGQNRYLDTYAGTCLQLARWGRALSDREIRELYLRQI
jgi:hypothetical protein